MKSVRFPVVLCVCILFFSGPLAQVAQGAAANGKSYIRFDIPSQPLDSALLAFAVQADINVAGLSAALAQFQSTAVRGSMTRAQALNCLLENTGLAYRIDGRGSVTIIDRDSFRAGDNAAAAESVAAQRVLEEIVVSATRRRAGLQNTPVAVTALNQIALDHNQVKDLRDLTDIVPGLEMTNTGPQSALLVQLRGIGTTNITEIADGPVALHVDGVYSPRSQGAATLLYDIDRVEVLRGPQGTLYGRNSTSGSINIHSQKPELDTVSIGGSLTYGSYNRRAARATINVAPRRDLALRFAAVTDSHDAYTELIDNYVGLGPPYPRAGAELNDYQRGGGAGIQGPEMEDQRLGRVSLLWRPSPDLSVFASAERYRDNGSSVTELDPSLVERGRRVIVADTSSFVDMTHDVFRTRVDAGALSSDDLVLSYIGGAARMTRRQAFDTDRGRDGSFEQQRTHSSEFDFFSHELQLVNGDHERFRWILGAFYSRERNSIVFAMDQQNRGGDRMHEGASSWISDDEGAAVAFFIQPDREVESRALYGQGTYSIDASHRIAIGARRTLDTKSDRGGRNLNCRVTSTAGPYVEPGSIGPGAPAADQIYADAGARAAIAAGLPYDHGTDEGIGDEPCWVRQVNDYSATWSDTSGLLRYEWDPFDGLMGYVSVASGFKSGHIQDRGNEAKPEKVVNYELGIKSTWLDGTLRLNTALYRADYTDLQFSNLDRFDADNDGIADTAGSTVVRNAARATVAGLELELEWALGRADHLQLALALMDAEFGEFEIPDTLFGDLFNPYASPGGETPRDPVDLSGNTPVITPDWKLTVAYEHDFDFAWGTLTPRVKATFSDEYFLDVYNRTDLAPGVFEHMPNGGKDLSVQRAYQSYDLSLRFAPRSQRWTLEAYLNNATDAYIKTASGSFITEKGFDAIYVPPRTGGINFRFDL